MAHYYHPYTLAEMMADSKLPKRIQMRIAHLVSIHAISIEAARGKDKDDTFVAYASGMHALCAFGVLLIHIWRPGGAHVAFDLKHRPADYLEAVAGVLTRYKHCFVND